jgi:hypothetical protein
MGFFSWITSEGYSISNKFTRRGPLPVYMYLPCGEVYFEPNYEGYGEFAGFDYYDLVAKLNLPESQLTGDVNLDRDLGIQLEFSKDRDKYIFPRFSIYANTTYEKLKEAKMCPDQGYFYWDDEDEDEEEEY